MCHILTPDFCLELIMELSHDINIFHFSNMFFYLKKTTEDNQIKLILLNEHFILFEKRL